MADLNNPAILKLFGLEIRRSKKEEEKEKNLKSFVPPEDEGDPVVTQASGAHFAHLYNPDGTESQSNANLIRRYRGAAAHPEVDDAIENIVSEAIVTGETEAPLSLVLDDAEISDSIKKKITEEFKQILRMLNFSETGYDIFKRWYIDGKLYHHLVVQEGKEKEGIQEIRPIDAAKIYKHRQAKEKIDPKTGAKIIEGIQEFFVYEEQVGNSQTTLRLTPDSISYVASGILSEDKKKVVSHLHKALKPLNQLRMMEDSLVIYRMARAPERRIFYIDVGNMPRGKAEEYLRNVMSRYRNKIVYDATTGDLKDDRKHMSLLEDFWLPRKEGNRGTEISTLPGGENLGQIEDVLYFQKRLFKSLNVPVGRLESETSQFTFGRSTEISREEVQFQKFIDRLRTKFSRLFFDILRKQLLLKQIVTEEDWDSIRQDMYIDYPRDNFFAEMKNAEIMRERAETIDRMRDLIGVYFSREWVMKEVLRMSEEEIKEMKKQLEQEKKEDSGENEDQRVFDYGLGSREGGLDMPPRPPQPKAPNPPEEPENPPENNKSLNKDKKEE